MTSVQRFLRQRSVGNTVLSASGLTSSNLYVFNAGSGNYIGNYPPGYMLSVATAVSLGSPAFPTPIPATAVLRDMGKTIQASYSAAGTGADLGTSGFFREVQLLLPSSVATFGVGMGSVGAANGAASYPAGNPGDDGYGTFYVPIVVGGVLASGVSLNNVSLLLGNSL